MTDVQLNELYDSLTLEEKTGQLTLLNAIYYGMDGMVTGDTTMTNFTDEELWNIGGLMNIVGRAPLKKLQEEHLKHNKVPLIFMADIYGSYRTEDHFADSEAPSGLCMAGTFDPELVEKIHRIIGNVAAHNGISVTYYPTVDIARDARWGRCGETCGEDVYLSCKINGSKIKGFQGSGIGSEDGIISCIKHFAAYGASESGRDYNNVELSEHELREVYLKTYESAIKDGAGMVMTSFNTLAGVPMSENKDLIDGVLRKEWGFDGPVISDYSAIRGVTFDQASNTQEEAAQRCLEAGVDIDMMDSLYSQCLPKLIREGKMSEKVLKKSVMRVLKMKNDLGILDDPYKFLNNDKYECEDNHPLNVQAAVEGIVLLKNENILPLKNNNAVLVGPFNVTVGQGLVFEDQKNDCITISKELNIPYERGCPYIEYDNFLSIPFREKDPTYKDQPAHLQRAIELAKNADNVIVSIGEAPGQYGESRSRARINIPQVQMDLLRKVYEVNKNIITVITAGRPLEIEEICKMSKAVFYTWNSGSGGAEALKKLILGEAVPSGRLPMCLPYAVGQEPLHYDIYPTGHRLGEPDDLYTSRFIDVPYYPLYSFGYGQSYTKFEYSNVTVDKNVFHAGESIKVSATVTNVGDYDADEVVQMYIHDCTASGISRPIKQLKGFSRIHLNRGESKTVEFTVDEKTIEFYDYNCVLKTEDGKFEAFVGGDSYADKTVEFYYEK